MRQLNPALVKFWDTRLAHNRLFLHAVANPSPASARIVMVEAARTCVGWRERTGNNDGERIEWIQDTIGRPQNESYCMGGMQSLIGYAEKRTGLPSPILASEGVMDVWTQTPFSQRVRHVPLSGAIYCGQHGKSWKGHTGLVLDCDGEIQHCIEFNTTAGSDNPDGKIEREGGGVYYTTRRVTGYGDLKILGWLKPF